MDLALMVGDAMFNYRVGLLIRRGRQILVEINPKFEVSTIPGGRIKTLEDSKNAIIRELSEEMKIDFSKDNIRIKALIENFFYMEEKNFHEVYILYKVNIDQDDDRFSDDMINYDSEASYYKWVDMDKLASVNLMPKVLRHLKDDNSFEHYIVNDLK